MKIYPMSLPQLRSLFLLLAFVLLLSASSCTSQENAPAPLLDFEAYTFSGVTLDISGETENARATFWHPEGGVMYISSRNTESVASYETDVPWDLGEARFAGSLSVSEQLRANTGLSVAHGLFIRPDGHRLWVFNRTEMWAWDMETAWDLSTAEAIHFQDFSPIILRGHDMDFHPDGSMLFIDDRDGRAVHQYRLSEPWDITTAAHVHTLDISALEEEVRGIEFLFDGRLMLLLDTVRMELMQFTLSEPWQIATAVYHSSLDLSGETRDPRGLSISPDFCRFYITAREQGRVYTYIHTSCEKDG
ncbi:MAG: hypothetical protein LAT75_08465 [Candidatus Cyclonatronum sp.]|uniref:hypothetical protein n=1 Tax=Cyclonatronum sp. TaxID=3024185 RepID=UPI0025BC422A|nr:hypothetical protein [Cyclonatronum sp.]MCH8486885.1 hypothetical protein [Cyclonatronum sp.]